MIKAYHVFLYLPTYHVSMYDYVCVVYLFLLESPRSIAFLETAPRPAGPPRNLAPGGKPSPARLDENSVLLLMVKNPAPLDSLDSWFIPWFM